MAEVKNDIVVIDNKYKQELGVQKKISSEKTTFVRYSNELNTYDLSNLSVLQRRFLMLCLSKAIDKGTTEIVLSKQDIKDNTNIRNYTAEEFDGVMTDFASKIFGLAIFKADKSGFAAVHITRKVNWVKEAQELRFTLDAEGLPFCNNINGGKFTMFEIKEFSSIRDEMGQQLYQIMKQWRVTGRTGLIDLKELRIQAGISQKTEDKMFYSVIRKSLKNLEKHGMFTGIKCEFIKSDNPRKYSHMVISFDRQKIVESYYITANNGAGTCIDDVCWLHGITGLDEQRMNYLRGEFDQRLIDYEIKRLLSYSNKNGYHTVDRLEQWLVESKNRIKARDEYLNLTKKTKKNELLKSNLDEIFPGTYQGVPYDVINTPKAKENWADLAKFLSKEMTKEEYASKWGIKLKG